MWSHSLIAESDIILSAKVTYISPQYYHIQNVMNRKAIFDKPKIEATSEGFNEFNFFLIRIVFIK